MTALLAFAAANQDTPVNEVIQLLENQLTDLQKEHEHKTGTYTQFASECRDLTTERSNEADTKSGDIEAIASEIEHLQAKDSQEQEEILELNQRITASKSLLQETENAWKAYFQQYSIDKADAEAGKEACAAAAQSLQSGMGMELLQIHRASLQRMIQTAGSMQISVPDKLTSLLQTNVSPDDPEYKTVSGNILTMIEKLGTTFTEKQQRLVTEKEREHDSSKNRSQSLKADIVSLSEAESAKQAENADTRQEIADGTRQITQLQASLHDNQVYLKELTNLCQAKASLWDQHSTMFDNEEHALQSALSILKDDVRQTQVAVRRALLQKNDKPAHEPYPGMDREDRAQLHELSLYAQDAEIAKANVATSDDLSTDDDMLGLDVEEADDAVSFMQVAELSLRRQLSALVSPVARRNAQLSALAVAVRRDPLASIKRMLKQLIDRLLEEHNAEIGQDAFCNEELGKSRNQRDFATARIVKLSALVQRFMMAAQKHEADRNTYQQKARDLTEELEHQKAERLSERQDNLDDMATQKDGLKALKKAIKLLYNFYRDAGNVQLLQTAQSPVERDIGASGVGSQKYRGNQQGGANVLSMLEVIQTDYERAIKQTEEAEAQASSEFEKMSRAAKASIASNKTGQQNSDSDRTTALAALAKTGRELTLQRTLQDAALKQLEALRPACIDTGMTYEQRKAAREEEIRALEQARELLQPH